MALDTLVVVIAKILAVYVGSTILWVMLCVVYEIFLSIFYAMFNLRRE